MYYAKTARPQSASLLNTINKKTFDNISTMTYEKILKIFPEEVLTKAWNTLSQFVYQNYTSGKGTIIKGFGTFTFTNFDVSLEGTTNQFQRDYKKRKPVFIVSNEFVEHLRPGQYNAPNGLIYYNQKQNNTIGHVKCNYAELAYSMDIKKDNCVKIIQSLFHYLADKIRRGEFKNKEMPNIGLLIQRGNVLGVKFSEKLEKECQKVPEKLYQTKKNVQMYIEPDNYQNYEIKQIDNINQRMKQLRPKSSVVTRITEGGQQWLKDNLNLDLDKECIGEDDDSNFNKRETIHINEYEDLQDIEQKPLNFINDKHIKSKTTANFFKNKLHLRDLNIPLTILQSIEYHKSIIIKEFKKIDKNNTGGLSKPEIIRAINKSNVHAGLTSEMINQIVKLYITSNENIDYMRLMTLLLREIKELNGPYTTKQNYFDVKGRNRKETECTNQGPNFNNTNLSYRENELQSIENELKTIKIVCENIKIKYRTRLDQIISTDELIKILRSYEVVYPKEKIIQILRFIDMPDINRFTLIEFCKHINDCKILSSEIVTEDIVKNFIKLKDIIYLSGGKNFLFPKNKTEITKEEFIDLFAQKTKFSKNLLNAIFNYLVKNKRNFTIEDYDTFFTKDQRVMNELFDEELIREFNRIISRTSMKLSEYFSHALSYNLTRSGDYLTRTDFHRLCLIEKFKYNAEEVDHFFDLIDFKKDEKIDREEFCKVIGKIFNPSYQIQDVIKKYKLDGEDLAHRMEIDLTKNEKLDYFKFKSKIKKLDYTYSDNYIQQLFNEIKEANNNQREKIYNYSNYSNYDKSGEYVTTNQLMDFLNVYSKQHFRNMNNTAFTSDFIETIQHCINMETLKNSLEKLDCNHNGRITKADFCSVIEYYTSDFKDEDIMKFTRIKNLVDNNNLVKYPEFLDLIYYDSSEDEFNTCLELLKKYLENECQNKLIVFFQKLNHEERNSIYDITKTVTLQQFKQFINQQNFNPKENTLCKFDLDSDGLISYEDLQGIFGRYDSTLFFKFKNDMNTPTVDLYADAELTDDTFKEIVRLIKKQLKLKNLTEVGLFKKLDINDDGFVSNYEFNKRIDDIILLSPSIKDQFYNYLDYYHNGLVDLKTFLFRFKEFKSDEVLVRNDNKLETEILEKLSEYLQKESQNYSDIELFKLMDADGDGIINLDDFRSFCINHLNFLKVEMNDFKLQRVLQTLSITKNSNVTFIDFKDIFSKYVNGKEHIDFKDKFKETINQNLSVRKTNKDWINEVIEKFSLFICERFDSIEEFYEQNTQKGSGKFTYENFIEFHKKNYECFDSFNLTEDELLAIYTTLDSQKKNYLTLDDLKNKLSMFDFYKKMHWDIKGFITDNFNNSVDAFKFFLGSIPPNYTKNQNSELKFLETSFLTRKDFFTAIQKFFPNKYVTETILKYMRKNFKNIDKISFSEFNYTYFDTFEFDSKIESDFKSRTKLKTEQPKEKPVYSSVLYKADGLNEKLVTPYDNDPLLKLKRILNSSPVDYKTYFTDGKPINQKDIINIYEFRNIIKGLNIGLTHIEIEDIINKIGKTRDGKVNYKQFRKFILAEDKNLIENKQHVNKFIGEVKQLMYKYYSTPKLAFQFNDKDKTNYIDFNDFKSMVNDLYSKECQPTPNFSLIKSAFDTLSLRKNGIIDLREWNKAFAQYEGKLDVKLNPNQMNSLREWENSNDMQNIYNEIHRNRKMLLNAAKRYFMRDSLGNNLIQVDNMIQVLQEILPRTKLSRTQWKIMANLGDRNKTGVVDFDLFLKVIGSSAKLGSAYPKP